MHDSFDLEKLRKDNPGFISKNPFEHQKDAFEKLSLLFNFSDNDHKSGILVLPTGAGKTFTSINWICRNVLPKNVKVLWLAHTGHLLEQAYETFRENLLTIPKRETINIRLVSSDPMHSKVDKIELSDDVLIITTQTAISNSCISALDGKGIKRKTKFEQFIEHSKINRLFVVLDEAHHAPAYGCRNLLIGGSNIRVGIRQIVPSVYFLGLTATPTYSDERRRGWLWEIFKDRIIYEVDKADLTRKNILAVPNPIQRETGKEIEVDDILYDTLVRQHKDLPEFLIEKLASDSGRNDYIVDDYIKNHNEYGKTLIFADRWFQCVYIKEKLIQKANSLGISIKVDAVYSHLDNSGSTASERNSRTTSENTKILHEFKHNNIDVLLNVRMLSEGTDVPDVRTVFITRQTTSSILLTQMIGRALRGKEAGGGKDKEIANIVFFVDNWKKVINFATPLKGGIEDQEPQTRGRYPIEYISIKLVEELSRKIDSNLVFSDCPFLDTIPVGWYETEAWITIDEDNNYFREFVIVFESTQHKYERFINHINSNLPVGWEDENLKIEFAEKQANLWVDQFFDEADNKNQTLNIDLIKIARHIGQSKRNPKYYSFEERNKHNLSQIAEDLLPYNEFDVQEKLNDVFNDCGLMWRNFYKSYNRFKTAFDAERNRIFHIKKFGSEPNLKIEKPRISIIEQRELTEQEKEQVFQRDSYTCQCCGKIKEKGRRIKFEVDHIVPFKFGGETSINNSQTLCSICNSIKNVNEINFKVNRSPLSSAKDRIELYNPSNAEYFEEILKRIVNLFYHCKAVAEIKWDTRPRSKYRYDWEIILFEGNNPEWLIKHINKIENFIKKELKYNELQRLNIN